MIEISEDNKERKKKRLNKLKNSTDNSVEIIYLGGVGEIGKNMTAIRSNNQIIIIDCGLAFPNHKTPGIDLIIPDFTYLREKKEEVKSLFVTHGHEDHIGAITYLVREFPDIEIYASKLTIALIRQKIEDTGYAYNFDKLNVVDNEIIKNGVFEVEFITVNHSIAGARALYIKTPAGYIFHTGDFKIDHSPIAGEKCSLQELARIGAKGVTLLMSESTNIEKPGYTISEQKVIESIDTIFDQNRENRIIITTFASNVHRVNKMISIAKKYGRKVIFSGTSMKKVFGIADKEGIVEYDRATVIEQSQIDSYKPGEICIICTGAQGEPMSALSKMIHSQDKRELSIEKGDLIVISSTPIAGNEQAIYSIINNLFKKGANVIYGSLHEVHTSGHACREELKIMLSLINPKFFIPVHGEYRHLYQHANLAKELGIDEKNIMIVEIGTLVNIKNSKMVVQNSKVSAGSCFVDGNSQDIDSFYIRDRRQLSSDGIVVVILRLSAKNEEEFLKPEIVSKGVVLEEGDIADMEKVLAKILNKKISEYRGPDQIERDVRDSLRTYLVRVKRQRPIILPIILEM